MADIAFQLNMGRAVSGTPFSGVAYGLPTEFVFVDPQANYKYYQSQNVVDTNGALAGQEVEVKVVRDGDDAQNTSTFFAVGILLDLYIPVKNVAT